MVQYRRDLLVDPGLADPALADDGVGASEHEEAELHGVDAEVEERAAALGEVEMTARGIDRAAKAEVRLDQQRFADLARAEDVAQRAVRREETRPHRLHDEAVPGTRRVDHVLRLRGVQRERLLAQHVLARFHGEDRVGRVARMRRRDVDRVDVGIRHQILVVPVVPLDPEPLRERFGAFSGA